MRRRHEGQPERRRPPHTLLDHDPGFVDRDGHEFGARLDQAVACPDRARILEPDLVARVEQRGRNELEGLLCARHHEDLLPFAGNAAIEPEMRGNGLTQAAFAMRIWIAEDLMARLAPVLAREPGPLRHREGVERRHGGGKSPRLMRQAGSEQLRRRIHGLRQPDACRRGGDWSGRRLGTLIGERPADIGARTDARLDQPFRCKALEALDDRRARDPEFLRQRTGCRQTFPDLQCAAQDQLAQSGANLDAESVLPLPIEDDRLEQRTFLALDHVPSPFRVD